MGKRPRKKPGLSEAFTPLAQALDGPTAGLLRAALGAAVPLWIEKVRLYSDEYRVERAGVSAQVIAEHGDDILYRSPKKGETAMAFNHLAEALAIGAFAPGGIKFLGEHWKGIGDGK